MNYTELLNSLVNGEVDNEQKATVLQQLREEYTTRDGELTSLTNERNKIEKGYRDLTVSNSKLFRQIQTFGGSNIYQQEKPKEKSFSETVTIESLMKNVGL